MKKVKFNASTVVPQYPTDAILKKHFDELQKLQEEDPQRYSEKMENYTKRGSNNIPMMNVKEGEIVNVSDRYYEENKDRQVCVTVSFKEPWACGSQESTLPRMVDMQEAALHGHIKREDINKTTKSVPLFELVK